MSIDSVIILNCFVIAMGLLFITYVIYGRIKRKPLIGDYKPGMPGYEEFLKIVNNNLYLVAAIAATIFAIIGFINDAVRVMGGSYSKAVLIAAPLIVITTCLFILWFARRESGKDKNNKK